MIPMDPQDARINFQVRAILNSRYIDTSKVVISEINNIVESISRITGVKDVVNEMTLVELKKISEAAVTEEAE